MSERAGDKSSQGVSAPLAIEALTQENIRRLLDHWRNGGRLSEWQITQLLDIAVRSNVASPLSSTRPRGAYKPLTEEQIEACRQRLDRLAIGVKELDHFRKLCDMATNCLLYAEEIQRLRGDAGVAVSAIEALDLTRLRDALQDHERDPGQAMQYPDRYDTPEGEVIEAAKELIRRADGSAKEKP